ncbi:CIA30 family protein [Winogradskyella sp.]|uniref:CIA30 family protein n=1 Tax=Winogradskyella sp. TaxID=1883156 RepID=UPI0025FABCC5|nr:CIA30 family protein [Winogradskyella sp.]
MQQQKNMLFDFTKTTNTNSWYVVNDGVMGGLSQSTMQLNNNGHGVFSGYVTTENNGGFASIRHAFSTKDVTDYDYIVLRVKGDNKTYQCRLKADEYQRFTYVQEFKTSGDWQSIKLPLKDFYPYFRGYRLNRPNFNDNKLEQIGILIGNKTNERFSLEIASIHLE